jgi:hypothetical protein
MFTEKIKKTIATVFLLTTVFFSVPSQSQAAVAVVTDPGNQAANTITSFSNVAQFGEAVKEALIEAGKQILSSIAKRILARLTRDTITWINGGFQGKPFYLQDPQGFFVDLKNQEIKNLVNTIGYDPINYPFGRDIAIGLIEGTKDYFAQNAKYSLDQVIGGDQNRVEFQTNFSLGGWNAYTALSRPNNNRFGSQLLAKSHYTKITAGLTVNPGELLRDELLQGKGFFSDKKCVDPVNYQEPPVSGLMVEDTSGDGVVDQAEYQAQQTQYNIDYPKCIKWQTLTPGTVVGDLVSQAVTSKGDQLELAQALGNSVSAVFDALLNKLVSDGLSALGDASVIPVQQDNFNYLGYSLGSNSTTGTQSGVWDPTDVVIDLNEFRNEISNSDPENPGSLENLNKTLVYQEQITQELQQMPSAVRALDICIPGPNRFWQERMDKEFRREAKKLEKKAESKNPKKSQKAIRALRALEYTIEEFKNFVTNAMLLELPSSPLYMDEIANYKNNKQNIEVSTDQKLKYKTLIAKTTSIKNVVNNAAFIPGQLTTAQEIIIKNEYKKYLALRTSIPNQDEVARKELELEKLQENRARIQDLTDECGNQRIAKGWSTANSTGTATINGWRENQLFCDWPMNDGYSYGNAAEGESSDNSQSSDGSLFDGEDADEGDGSSAYVANDRFTYILVGTHLQGDGQGYDIPIVNAIHVYKRFLTNVNIDISCDFVYPATLIDYMSDDPGAF